MSWLEKIKTDFSIKTGDGRVYKPKWKNPTKSIEYNTAEFDFIEKDGTLVKRARARGAKYPLEIYFDGEDHLDVAQAFEISAKDSRAWAIEHPVYGPITVQPTSLEFDNTNYNISKVTGTLIETITDENPQSTVAPVDQIVSTTDEVNETFSQSFSSNVIPSTNDIARLSDNNTRLYKEGIKLVKLKEQAEEYFNLYNKANTAIIRTTSDPLAAMRALQAVITYPAYITASTKSRLNTLVNQFNQLTESISNLFGKSDKRIYENNGGELITAMALTTATPQSGDYGNRNDVVRVIDTLQSAYNLYMETLDDLQTDNGGGPDSFIPDAGSLIQLNKLVNYTISNLFDIALNSKQERAIFCEEDTNIILLAHRFYGLLPDDSTIEQLMVQNDISLNELLHIRKGRKIIYYV